MNVLVNGSIRLRDNDDWPYNNGPLQVYHDNMWHYICIDSWSDITAINLTCRTLGFRTTGIELYLTAHNDKFLPYEVQCNGTEIAQCKVDFNQSLNKCTAAVKFTCPLQGMKCLHVSFS